MMKKRRYTKKSWQRPNRGSTDRNMATKTIGLPYKEDIRLAKLRAESARKSNVTIAG
jgi:hypothetical protein